MGDVKMTDNSDEVIKALYEQADAALEAIGLQAEKYAKLNLENHPRRIDTGRLRNSISHAVEDDAAYIGTNVEYAPYVEYGTQKMEANHFLRNAANDHTDEYKQIMEKYLKD